MRPANDDELTENRRLGCTCFPEYEEIIRELGIDVIVWHDDNCPALLRAAAPNN